MGDRLMWRLPEWKWPEQRAHSRVKTCAEGATSWTCAADWPGRPASRDNGCSLMRAKGYPCGDAGALFQART